MIRFLIEKEFKLIRRNPFMPRLIIMMPVIMMLIMPLAANMEVRNINLSVIDNDRSTFSSQLIEKVISSGYFHLVECSDSYTKATESVELGLTDVILEIPNDFQQDFINGTPSELFIAANAVNATKAGMGTSYLVSIIQNFTSGKVPVVTSGGVQVVTQNRFNPLLNYRFYMVPALMVMLLTIMCGFLPALNIVGEKESGTIEQMNVTPVGRLQFILAKVIPYWVIGYVVLTICFAIAFLVYGLIAVGSYFTVYVSAMLFILTVSGLGLVISNYSSTMQQAMFVMFFFMLVMILLSGLFTPVQSMPDWAQNITIFNPLKYFMQIMRGVYLKGSDLNDVWIQLTALGSFAVVLNSWAILSYRKQG